jgi:hypothetical protein
MSIRSMCISALVIGTAVLPASLALAEERVCRGTIGAATVDNLRVPSSATCRLNGTKVKGTIKVERNAVLVATDVLVIGNVQGENAKNVVVQEGSSIGGSVQVKQGGGAAVLDSRVNADIQYDANSAALRVQRNRVGGSVQVIGNRLSNNATIIIARNTIDGNLQCKENTPRPTGGNNVVGGNKEDQCARL